MRLLHISDWHLGVTLGRVSRALDHDEVLAEIIEIARAARPSLIVHTGDLFHHPRPGVDDLRRGMAALGDLAAVAPVVVLAGNHDSPALFELFEQILRLGRPEVSSRLRFVPRARPPEDGGILNFPGDTSGGAEEVRLAPLPFVHPNALLDVFKVSPERWTADYADQVQLVEEALGKGLADGYDPNRHILLFGAHLYVGGATWSRSERPLHVSETYATKVDHLPPVTYAAFGHIHRPQPLPGGLVTGRYAGSPIPIDFGEEGEQKSVVLVDAEPGRPAHVEVMPLTGGRPLRRVTGRFDALARLAPEVGRAIVSVTVDTDQPTPDLYDQVAALLPEATLLDVQERCAATTIEVVAAAPDGPEPTVRELFQEYLGQGRLRGAGAAEALRVFDTLLEAAEAEVAATFAEEALFVTEAPPGGARGSGETETREAGA
jgi:DNA repair protein SbcD/Mre11